jgi:uncharacterized protein YndB with AHSA1/START domain
MTATTATDRIEKTVIVKAPRSRVWQAISDTKQFGEWFKVKLDGPFKAGETIRGTITYPGYEGHKMEMAVERIEPERLFSYRWHPGDPNDDYSAEPMTLVEFTLEDVPWWHPADHRRIRLRQDSTLPTSHGVPDERRRLDGADAIH